MDSVVATTSVGLFAAGNGLVFALWALLVSGGQLTAGAVYMLFRYVDLLPFDLRVLTLQLDDLQRVADGAARSPPHPNGAPAAPSRRVSGTR